MWVGAIATAILFMAGKYAIGEKVRPSPQAIPARSAAAWRPPAPEDPATAH